MRLRFVTKGDETALLALEEASFVAEERISPAVLASFASHSSTSLVVEDQGQVCAFLLTRPIVGWDLTDQVYFQEVKVDETGSCLAVASLAVAQAYKGQGLGSLLLASLKDLVVNQGWEGISLTCHEELLSFYCMNGFEDLGIGLSQFGGSTWYQMRWKA